MRFPATYASLPGPQEATIKYASDLASFISEYLWLVQIHAYDIVTHNFFHTSWPTEWKCLADASSFNADDLMNLATDGIVKEQWPKSFQAFVQKCISLQLPRSVDLREFGGCLDACDDPVTRAHTAAAGMSRKKLYEVERFSNLILDHTFNSPFKDAITVIDVGAGQGYLTHRLTTKHPCVAVDFDQIQTVGSKARGNDIKRGKFKDSRMDMKSKEKLLVARKEVIYKTAHIDQESLKDIINELESDPECRFKDFALVGLHACGDLSATAMLNTFAACESVKILAVVPCCFNLLSEASETTDELDDNGNNARHLQSLCKSYNLKLGHTARNLACQNFDSFSKPIMESSLRNHYKRALLGALLSHFNLESETAEPERGPSTFDAIPAGEAELCSSSIEKKHHKFRLNKLSPEALAGPFIPYAKEAVECLGLSGKLDESHILQFTELASIQNSERENFVVHCVRSLMSRVVESFLLMDRYLWLTELNAKESLGIQFDMLNLFDLKESPRNMVFLAQKRKEAQS
ncbi:methyltransferase domain-containing protein [Obelidium mucronatum]|nr:methyltransferase domain-containing protein [Obelidium mucronatum]